MRFSKGKENLVADALSRVEGSQVLHMEMTVLECDLMQRIKDAYKSDSRITEIRKELAKKPGARKHYV